MPNDITLPQLVLNKMTREQFEEAKAGGAISPTEMYLVDDVEGGGSGGVESHEYLIDLEEDVESIDFDFTDSKGNPVMFKEVLFVLHIKSVNVSGCDTILKYRTESGEDKTVNISNNYANSAGNWVASCSFAKIQGATIYCQSNKNVGASGNQYYKGSSINGLGVYVPYIAWGDRWREYSEKPIGITGMEIPGKVAARSQIYIYGVMA